MPGERTRAIYEDFPGHPDPPRIPLQDICSHEALSSIGLISHPISRFAFDVTAAVSGFRKYYRELPQTLDDCLKYGDLRNDAFPAAASATMAFSDDGANTDPFVRAEQIVRAAWQLHSAIRQGCIGLDMPESSTYEVRQCLNLFGTSLILDGSRFRVHKSDDTSHLLVVAHRKFYRVDVGENGNDAAVGQIAVVLQFIWQTSGEDRMCNTEAEVGMLSGAPTGRQRLMLRKLLNEQVNRESFSAARHSFLTICLDLDTEPRSYEDAARLANIGNPGNRWFHSSLQIVVFGNAKICAICNWSTYLDGNVMSWAVAALKRRENSPCIARALQASSLNLEALHWRVPQRFLDCARREITAASDSQRCTFELPECGRLKFKDCGLDPVPAFLVALQLATYRLTGRVLVIGQFVALSRYRYMDLEIAQITTPEMKRLLDAWFLQKRDKKTLRALLSAAIDSQKQRCREARSALSLSRILQLFTASQPRIKRFWIRTTFTLMYKILTMCGLFIRDKPFDIVVSHPTPYCEVPVMGRPGFRIPGVTVFALHYQITDLRTQLTFIPSYHLSIPNTEIVAELRQSVSDLFSLFSSHD